jgi:hypothetical protein
MVFRSRRSTRTALYFSCVALMAASIFVSMQATRPVAATAFVAAPFVICGREIGAPFHR